MTRSEDVRRLRSASDVELVRAVLDGAARGDTRAADIFIERHSGHVRANCEFLVTEPETARDLAQEAMVKAYFGLAGYRGDSTLRTWVRRIKVNHCLNHLARVRPTAVDLDQVPPSADPALRVEPPTTLDGSDHGPAVAAILAELTETLRVPLVLRDVDEFGYEEIAERLGIGLSAAKMRVARGRERFRIAWLERFGSPP